MTAQCAILFIGPCGKDQARIDSLRSLGFRVDEVPEMPTTEEVTSYHAIVVRSLPDASLPMLGTRLRAKRHFGRRVMLALVAAAMPERARREALMSGFDQVLAERCSSRDIAAQILRLLRGYPEYRCLLRAPNGRRKAA